MFCPICGSFLYFAGDKCSICGNVKKGNSKSKKSKNKTINKNHTTKNKSKKQKKKNKKNTAKNKTKKQKKKNKKNTAKNKTKKQKKKNKKKKKKTNNRPKIIGGFIGGKTSIYNARRRGEFAVLGNYW